MLHSARADPGAGQPRLGGGAGYNGAVPVIGHAEHCSGHGGDLAHSGGSMRPAGARRAGHRLAAAPGLAALTWIAFSRAAAVIATVESDARECRVVDRRAARMAGSSRWAAPMSKVAARPPARCRRDDDGLAMGVEIVVGMGCGDVCELLRGIVRWPRRGAVTVPVGDDEGKIAINLNATCIPDLRRL